MVTKIKIGTSIRGILHYNENKVGEGEAKLILASGFAGEIEQMTFENKLQRFLHLTELKPSVKTNAMHISLNFDTAEKITNAKMQEIAVSYMERIGFGDQPFLVYRHNDAGHEHLHVATTSIQRNGEVINMHNIGRNLSEPARKAIEKEFNLVVAEKKVCKQEPGIKAADLEKAKYGKSSTKRQISNVLSAVVNDYKFTSLAELNALLKQFNVIADRGHEETEMFQKKGLVYSLMDKNGKKIGIPIKSSSFYSKPTFRNLEIKFEKNKEKRKPYRQALIRRIGNILSKYEGITKETLIAELKNNGIDLLLRQNEHGRVYGTTFIDHQNRAIFNGSDLGKPYGANSLMERISASDHLRSFLKPLVTSKTYFKAAHDTSVKTYLEPKTPTNYLEDLVGESQPDYAPGIKRKRKKRRRGINL